MFNLSLQKLHETPQGNEKEQDIYSHSETKTLLSTDRYAVTSHTLSHEDAMFIRFIRNNAVFISSLVL